VVAHIEMEDLRDITLVGWSYGGMVVTGVLARIPERIKGLVYLDAFMPEDGEAVADYWSPEVKEIATSVAGTSSSSKLAFKAAKPPLCTP
jgi:pimeloyl-ACP methyl ester carboxylesterase